MLVVPLRLNDGNGYYPRFFGKPLKCKYENELKMFSKIWEISEL